MKSKPNDKRRKSKPDDKPSPPKKSKSWIWIIVAGGAFFVLLIVVLPAALRFGSRFAGAKIKVAQNQIAELKTPLSIYKMDIGSYPDSNQGLDALLVPPDLIDHYKWNGPYKSTDIPKDPWENSYQYTLSPGGGYTITSFGPDGEAGTDDDIIGRGF